MKRNALIALVCVCAMVGTFFLGRLTAPETAVATSPVEICDGRDNDCAGSAMASSEDGMAFMHDASGSMAQLMPEIARLVEAYAEQVVEETSTPECPAVRETIIIVPLIMTVEPEPEPVLPLPTGSHIIEI